MDQRRRIRDAYDEIAAGYDDRRTTQDRRLLDDLFDRLNPGSRVLNAGCGGGRAGLEGLDANHRTVGMDISREQLDIAADAGRGESLVTGDMTCLPFTDNAFDALTSFYVIIHVPTEEHPTVLEEFARVCRPGGWLLFSAGAKSGPARTTTGWRLAFGWSGRSPTLQQRLRR